MAFDRNDHFTLRDHPRNQGAVRDSERHETKTAHQVVDYMYDLPEGDVCDGLMCADCDWLREFPFKGKWRRDIEADRVRHKTSEETTEMAVKLAKWESENAFAFSWAVKGFAKNKQYVFPKNVADYFGVPRIQAELALQLLRQIAEMGSRKDGRYFVLSEDERRKKQRARLAANAV